MADGKKKAGRSKSGASSKRSPPKKGEPRPARTASTRPAGRPASGLEEALAEARTTIEALAEDRDAQVALAEAAEMEREALEQRLEEALRRIKQLESGGAVATSQHAAEPAPREVPLAFEDEEEEEPEGRARAIETDEEDDSIYDRMDDPRVRRQELDRERLDREGEYGDEPFWMTCPKCGDHLEETDAEDVKLERCESCGGIYLDAGEVRLLLSLGRGRDGLRRIRDVLET